MTPNSLEITILKAMWEEMFDLRMAAAEIHADKKADKAARMKAQMDLITYGVEMAKVEIQIRNLEKTP